MTSQAQAESALPDVRGLAFLGFPLHPAGKPGIERADHLEQVHIPMLFVSGDRDALAELHLLRPVIAELGDRATLHVIRDADHSLKVRASSGRSSAEAEAEALDAMAAWMMGTELECWNVRLRVGTQTSVQCPVHTSGTDLCCRAVSLLN